MNLHNIDHLSASAAVEVGWLGQRREVVQGGCQPEPIGRTSEMYIDN